ncbi:TPA: signal peptide peptidase SppA [Candidatus Woesearchaeota archaeon]|nr:Signal peptide peptidase SppA, 36K type [archaeon GW2011_AR15]MBS3104136.1 signal peptide peptidase SppA [Candidatus Woesearchaeota archaeon]HIH41416.1 signal peptide peptidase SppA [Candidatus Woesearchaeota archaeon]
MIGTGLKEKILPVLKILLILWIISFATSFLFGPDMSLGTGNVAIIPIHGVIGVEESSGLTGDTISSQAVIAAIDKAEGMGVKAIIFDINSPGGSGVAADEIAQRIKSANRTTIALIRDMGTSAAYWVASSTDYVYANRMSLTGSIGVIGSYLDFSGFLEEYNITYQRYVSGELKDMGSSFKEPSEEERRIFQDIIYKMNEFFIKEVAENRNMSVISVRRLATGQIFLGSEAKDLGLVDELGTRKDVLDFVASRHNITVSAFELEEKKGFLDIIFSGMGKENFINLNPSVQFR